MTLKLCQLIEHFVRNIFRQKSARNYALKASPRTSVNFGKKTQNCHCMQKIVLKIRYFDRALSKTLKKVNFIFPFKPNFFQ